MPSKKLINQIDILLNAEHFDEKVRKALLELGPEALKILVNYATGSHPSGDSDIQGRAILVLGESKDRSCLPALQKVLNSNMPELRVRAMRAMGRIGGDDAVRLISDVVQDKKCSDAERAHGIRALNRIKTKKAKETLASLKKAPLSKYVKSELRAATAKKRKTKKS